MKCEMCDRPNKWSNWDIKEYRYWRVGLHPDQRYLGRSLIMLNRHAEDLLEMTQEERGELFQILRMLTDALTKLFSPNKFNYASLGNEMPHLHLHVIPRYASPRQFEEIKSMLEHIKTLVKEKNNNV
ncbi:MAG: HIT family protein [Candidatus Yanofskybacteria bacterium]|nr:HIT family protein [Candidatus Yanofskybacteria bacterium]